MALHGLLATSIPETEHALAERHLPGALLTGEPLSPGLAQAEPEARVLAVMIYDPVLPETLARFPALEAVITRSDGTDHLPLPWLEDHGVGAYHLEGYATESVAELTLLLLLALARRVPEAMRSTGGAPPVWDRSALVGRSLRALTVGVLGTGRIGSEVVRLLSGLGVATVGHDLVRDRDLEDLPGFDYARDLDDLLGRIDALSVHVPLDARTRDLVDARALERLPAGALLVNTARGGVVDQEAVVAALSSGRLAGYAADVLPGEPDPPHLAALARHPRVLLTPHLGAHNHATFARRYEATAGIARAVLEGEEKRVARYRVH